MTDAAALRVEHVFHVVRHGGVGERGAQVGQVFRFARHHADVGVVALVAGARPGQFHQWHTGLAGGGVAAVGVRQAGHVQGCAHRHAHFRGGAVQVHGGGDVHLGHQGGEQADARHRLGPAADQPGQARRHAGGGLGDFPGEQAQRLAVVVQGGDLHHHFAAVLAARLGAVGGFAAEDFHAGVAHRRHAQLFEQAVGLFQDRRRHHAALGRRFPAAHQEGGGDALAVRVGGGHFIGVGGWQAAGAAYPDPVFAVLGQGDAGEVADHVRENIGARVADFVEHLLAHRGRGHQAAGAGRFGDHERAVLVALGDREAHVVKVRHLAPVGEVAAGALGAAFDHMAGQGALGELVVVVVGPFEFVHQRAQHQGRIGDAAGQHQVGAGVQRRLDRQGAQVGVHGHGDRRQAGAGVQLLAVAELVAAAVEVVAFHQGDVHFHAGLGEHLLQRLAAGARIDAAGVADHLYVLLFDLAGQRRHHLGDEVVGVAGAGILHAGARHDRQGHLRQVVEHQVVDLALADQLEGGAVGVAPEAGGAADANRSSHKSCPELLLCE